MRGKALSIVLSAALTVVTAIGIHEQQVMGGNVDVDVMVAAQSGGARQPGVGGITVTGLHPGAKRQMIIEVKNPQRFPISLTAVSGHLVATSRPGCKPEYANLIVGRYAGKPALPLTIAAGKQIRIGYLPITMPRTVANACQGATFTLRINATARKAGR